MKHRYRLDGAKGEQYFLLYNIYIYNLERLNLIIRHDREKEKARSDSWVIKLDGLYWRSNERERFCAPLSQIKVIEKIIF